MGVERISGVGMSVGVAVGSVVAVGTKAAKVCSTENFTHIWVASMPISGVGAACGLGAQDAANIIIENRIKIFLTKIFYSPNNFEIIKILYTCLIGFGKFSFILLKNLPAAERKLICQLGETEIKNPP